MRRKTIPELSLTVLGLWEITMLYRRSGDLILSQATLRSTRFELGYACRDFPWRTLMSGS
ncbi:hypothetical protein LINPERHAP2_LOCUS35023 [Linum perenne]